jgi:AcrR family transcriptional regulator
MRDAILRASVDTVVQHGLNEWTVEEVASKARCAKGLVNYHYRSKADLLHQTAEAIAFNRHARRLAAVTSGSGTPAVDHLWDAVATEVRSGWFAAWLSFVAQRARDNVTLELPDFGLQLRDALGRALELDREVLPEPAVLAAMLDGIALRLLLGEPEERVRDAFHRLLLGMLD